MIKLEEKNCFYLNMCDYKCKINETMSKHLSTKHEGYKVCEVIGNKFKAEDSLDTHMKEFRSN